MFTAEASKATPMNPSDAMVKAHVPEDSQGSAIFGVTPASGSGTLLGAISLRRIDESSSYLIVVDRVLSKHDCLTATRVNHRQCMSQNVKLLISAILSIRQELYHGKLI